MSTQVTKKCTKCGEEYPATSEYFFTDKTKTDCLYSSCKACRTKYNDSNRDKRNDYKKHHRLENIDSARKQEREYYAKNREQLNQAQRERRLNNIEEFRQKEKTYYEANKERIQQRTREWRVQNREFINQRNKEYRQEHPEWYKEQQRKHYKNNREKVLKHCREYAVKNPTVIQVVKNRHKMRKRNLPNTFTSSDWDRSIEYWQGHCAYCGQEAKLTMDHFIPLKNPNCPGTVPQNIVPSCQSCNSSKRNSDAFTWLKRIFGDKQAQAVISQIKSYFDLLIIN